MTNYHVQTGDVNATIPADTAKDAAQTAIDEAPKGTRFGIITVVTDPNEADNPTYFPTQAFGDFKPHNPPKGKLKLLGVFK